MVGTAVSGPARPTDLGSAPSGAVYRPLLARPHAGVKPGGTDHAIVRWEASGPKDFTMVYERGKWVDVTDDFWLNNLGKPVDQIIAAGRAAGRCAK